MHVRSCLNINCTPNAYGRLLGVQLIRKADGEKNVTAASHMFAHVRLRAVVMHINNMSCGQKANMLEG